MLTEKQLCEWRGSPATSSRWRWRALGRPSLYLARGGWLTATVRSRKVAGEPRTLSVGRADPRRLFADQTRRVPEPAVRTRDAGYKNTWFNIFIMCLSNEVRSRNRSPLQPLCSPHARSKGWEFQVNSVMEKQNGISTRQSRVLSFRAILRTRRFAPTSPGCLPIALNGLWAMG